MHGWAAPGFEAVHDAFAANFDERGEVGAAVAAYVDGRAVVDVCGGVADPATGAPYTPDTLQPVLSVTKGVAAAAAGLLMQRGLLDVDAPVADVWPEFAHAGKGLITVGMVLSHQAGLPVVDATLTLDEVAAWDPVVEALAAQRPVWEPGTAHGYHAITFGWLVGELVRRVDGRSFNAFLQEEIVKPLGIEWWVGLPEAEHGRVAAVVPPDLPSDPAAMAALAAAMGPGTLTGRALSFDGVLRIPVYRDPVFLSAEVPSANGVTTAASVARFYAALLGPIADGPSEPLLSPAQLDAACAVRTHGTDRILSVDNAFGLGFLLATPGHDPYGAPGAFGHPGAGGSIGFADRARGLAFAYTATRMGSARPGSGVDARAQALVRAVYDALDRS